MAKEVTVILKDDIDKSLAAETVSFGLDGVSYEIDLSEGNAAALREALALYVSHGTRVGGRKSAGNGRASAGRRGGNTAAVRNWARSAGYEVSERGRISVEILAAFAKANP